MVLIMNPSQFRECREARNRGYLRELARSLRPGGRVIIADGFVHTTGWASPRSDGPTECGNLPPAQLAALAGRTDLAVIAKDTEKTPDQEPA